MRHGALALELKRTEFGHLGLFPEQADCWDWIAARLGAVGERLQVLNLFGYSGGSTLAAAAAGAQVTHVDAARNLVAWARRNAELSGLASAPVRWIVDDARKFVRRALNRGERYHAVILDPPSYGHGARGEVWRLSKHLAPLVEMCGRLTAGQRQFILLTCHTPDYHGAPIGAAPPRVAGRRRSGANRQPRAGVAHGLGAGTAQRRGSDLGTDGMTMITSLQNVHVKEAVRLRDRRHREKQQRTLIDGARELARAIRAGVRLAEVFVCEALCTSPEAREAIDLLPRAAEQVFPVSEAVLQKLAFGQRSEGLVAVAEMPAALLKDLELPPCALVAVVEAVEKPGNLGAVLRSADGAGVSALIAADPRTDVYNPNAIRASLGTIFTVPVAAAATEETLAWLRGASWRSMLRAWMDPCLTSRQTCAGLARWCWAAKPKGSPMPGEATTCRRFACRCAGPPIVSTSRPPRQCSSTRRCVSGAREGGSRIEDGEAKPRGTLCRIEGKRSRRPLSIGQRHLQVLHEKRPEVGDFLDLFGAWACRRRVRRGCRCESAPGCRSSARLQRRRELETVAGNHAVVGIGGGHHRGRIAAFPA